MGWSVRTPVERIEARIMYEPMSGCWLCDLSNNPMGYAQVSVGSRSDGSRRLVQAHRVMYEHHVGPIGDGLHIDHLCRIHECVNPDHLEPVTPAENSRRGQNPHYVAHRTNTCRHGHSLLDAYVDSRGGRVCRSCMRNRYVAKRQVLRPRVFAVTKEG